MKHIKKIFLTAFLLFIAPEIKSIVKGSDTVVSVEPLASFPSVDSDNTMLGFGWFKNGFTLEDASTTCTFNSVYPVSGTVDMGGGTLTLLQDLIFHNITALNGMGNIIGNNYALDLCTTITAFPSNLNSLSNTHVSFHNDLVITNTVTLQGNCSFCGDGHSLIMNENGALVIDTGSHVTFQNLEIKGLRDSNIQCVDDTGTILLNDVVWAQDSDFAFLNGSMLLQDEVTFIGTSTFAFESSQTSTLDKNSTFKLSNGIYLSLGRDADTGNEPLAFIDSSSIMRLADCGFNITPMGLTLTKGTIVMDYNVVSKVNSSSFETGVTMGTGNVEDDFTIYFSPGCSVTQNGHMTYNNFAPDRFKSTSNSTLLVRGNESRIRANTDFAMPEITVQLVSDAVPPLVVMPGKALSFNNTSITLPAVSFDITGYQQNVFTYVLPGNGSINFSKGALPLYLVIAGTGNEIRGNGSVNGIVTFADAATELTFDITGYLGNSLVMNGGTVTLANDLMLYNNGIFEGPGTIDLTNRVLYVNSGVSSWETPIIWQGNGGGISMEQKLSLVSTWTVQGNCIIDGNNNELEFLEDGEIVIDSNSQLYLRNIRLQSIADVNIRCVDDTGVLVLDDVYWTQTDDYLFNKGSMRFVNEVDLVGSYTFFYESTQTSTIAIKSTLKAHDHINLSIGKQQVPGAQEPLALEDSSSLIIIDNAQWTINGDGMRITKGRAICSDDVFIDIISTDSTQGLKLGDGTQAGDMVFEFRPGATVRMPRGDVICDWFANNNLKSESTTAQLIRNAQNSFYCNCDINLSNLTIVTEPGALLAVEPGKTFSYYNCIFEVPGGVYNMNGVFYNAYTNLLNGNQYLTLLHGSLPLYTVVNGTGNVIDGNGSVSGQIIFIDSTGELTWWVNGSLANTASLNGGTLILGTDLSLTNGTLIEGPGVIDISNYSLEFGAQDLLLNTPINFNADGGQIELRSGLSLTSTWTVTGHCSIVGNGNTIDLGSTGEIVIDVNSTLCLENVNLKNIGNTNIKCLDDTGVLILANINWLQSMHDYTFEKGSIIIKDKVLMLGNQKFIYETTQTSTIKEYSQLILDSNFTFSYSPNSASDDLLEFIDSSSHLVLNGATLHATSTGLHLKKGTLFVQDTSYLASPAAITIGNSQLEDDFTLQIGLGSQLQFEFGSLDYKNKAVDSFSFMNDLSSLYFSPYTQLNLYESITYSQGLIKFTDNTTLAQVVGMDINGSIDLIGELTTIDLIP